jgi:hypothetical protein
LAEVFCRKGNRNYKVRQLAMENTFTGVFEKVEDWYIGYVQELPGTNSQIES